MQQIEEINRSMMSGGGGKRAQGERRSTVGKYPSRLSNQSQFNVPTSKGSHEDQSMLIEEHSMDYKSSIHGAGRSNLIDNRKVYQTNDGK